MSFGWVRERAERSGPRSRRARRYSPEMSAWGQKLTIGASKAMFAFGRKADVPANLANIHHWSIRAIGPNDAGLTSRRVR
jgi:hypothetical protein